MRAPTYVMALLAAFMAMPTSADEPTTDHKIYLGTCGPEGWAEATFDGLPSCSDDKISFEATSKIGLKVRGASGDVVRRLKAHSAVTFAGMTKTSSYAASEAQHYWGRVSSMRDGDILHATASGDGIARGAKPSRAPGVMQRPGPVGGPTGRRRL